MTKIQTLAEPEDKISPVLSKGYVLSAAMASLWRKVRAHGITSPEVARGLEVWGELYEEAV